MFGIIFLPGLPDVLNDEIANYYGWDKLSKTINLELIQRNIKRVDWSVLSGRCDIGDFLRKYKKKIDWYEYLSSPTKKDVLFLSQNRDKIVANINAINNSLTHKCQYYSDNSFVDAFSDVIDWMWLGKNIKLPEYLLDRYFGKLHPLIISANQNLTKRLYKKYWKYLEWKRISKFQKLSEQTILNWRHLINWKNIFTFQKLSGRFLESDGVPSKAYNITISTYQNLDDDFIERNLYWLDVGTISTTQNMSIETINRLKSKLNWENLMNNVNYNRHNSTINVYKNKNSYIAVDSMEEKIVFYFNHQFQDHKELSGGTYLSVLYSQTDTPR